MLKGNNLESCKGGRNIAVGEVRKVHITHGEYDINVRTTLVVAGFLTMGIIHGISARRESYRRVATLRGARNHALPLASGSKTTA